MTVTPINARFERVIVRDSVGVADQDHRFANDPRQLPNPNFADNEDLDDKYKIFQ